MEGESVGTESAPPSDIGAEDEEVGVLEIAKLPTPAEGKNTP